MKGRGMSEAQGHEFLTTLQALASEVREIGVSVRHQDKVLRGDGTTSGLAENVRQALRLIEAMQGQLSGFEARIQHIEAARVTLETSLHQRMAEHEHRVELRLAAVEGATNARLAEAEARPDKAFAFEAKAVLRAISAAGLLALFSLASYGWGVRHRADDPPKAPPGATTTR